MIQFDDKTIKGRLMQPAVLLLTTVIFMIAGISVILYISLLLKITSVSVDARSSIYIAIFGAVVVMIAVSVAFLVAAYIMLEKMYLPIITPLQYLVTSIKERAAEDARFFKHNFKDGEDLGILTESFNSIVANIRAWEKTNEQRFAEFEREAKSRTWELSKANELLERTVMDVEALKEFTEAEAKTKSQFLANVSLGIHTSLNGILKVTALILETKMSRKQRTLAETVSRSCEDLLVAINDVVEYSRTETFMLELQNSPFDLRSTTEEVISLMADRAQSQGLDLVYLMYQDVPLSLIGDPLRLRQLIINLIENSLKFTKEGEISVIVSVMEETANDALIKFEVRDSGIGIAPSQQQSIFHSIYQADSSLQRKYDDPALGLPISKKLSYIMGGNMGVESTLGRGSTFWFTVRMRKQTVPLVVEAADKRLQGASVIIIDDNVINRSMLYLQLTEFGMKVSIANNASQGRTMLLDSAEKSEPFQIAIINKVLQDMDGLELAKTLKDDPRIAQVPLVMQIPIGEQPADDDANAAVIEAHIFRPVHHDILLTTLVNVLHNNGTEKPLNPVNDDIMLTTHGNVLHKNETERSSNIESASP
jgi:signal transduction histidine kinase/CheY-like chemotaxis protein